MAFFIDSVQTLATRARNAFRSEMPGTDAWLFPNNVVVAAKVFAGVVWSLFGALQRIDKNRFIMSADAESVRRYGNEYGLTQNGPTYAQGVIDVACVSPFTVAAGTIFSYQVGQTTLTFSTTTAVASPNYPVPQVTSVQVQVVAQQTGANSNLPAGTPLTCGLAGVTAAIVDIAGITGGTDGESLDDFRLRVLHRRQTVPAGGNEDDYVQWMKAYPGCTRAWAVGNGYGPGTVACWFLMDDTYPFGLPQQSDVAAMQAYLDGLAPVTANVLVQAPYAVPIPVVVQGLAPDTPATRNAAALELNSVFRRMVGVSVPASPTTLYQSWLWRAVSNAAGEQHHTIRWPVGDQTYQTGQIPILQSVAFVP